MRGGGDGVLVLLFAGQEEAQQIGRHEQGLGVFQQPGTLVLQANELVERIERQALDPGAAIELGGRNAAAQLGLHGTAAHVAIVVGIAQELVGGIEQPVVEPPGIDAEGRQGIARLMRGHADGVFDLVQQTQDVPVDAVADARGNVRKAMHFANFERAVAQRAEHGPSAGGAEIDREVTHAGVPSASMMARVASAAG